MLRMAQVQYIKDLYENEEKSLREISRITGHSFETVQKYAQKENWNEDNLPDTEPTSYPVLGEFIPIVDGWLEADNCQSRSEFVDKALRFYEAVKWAEKNGITGGIGNGLFGPNQPCTRAQIVTFLWRAAGSPEPKAMSSFADVSTDAYYAKAVAWAVENGITTGTGDGKFSPDATCTRAQSVTFLFRAIGKLVDSKAEFSDVLTDSYYANAVAWAVENGVTNGIGDGLFGPDNSCTRAQIVTFLYRAYQGK